jgi:drug/metabolite transporter (DMT)-like permease
VRGPDWALLSGIVVLGGILGPVLMLWGLQRVSAVVTSLLSNLEAPFTVLVAVTVFGEHLGRRATAGAAFIVAAAIILSYTPGEARADLPGVCAVAGACLCWAVDNNLTQRLSLRDPIVVTRIKALGAGTCTLALALLSGQSLPRSVILMAVLLLGLLSYGVSIVLDMHALRLLGAAREAAYFATAPFIGALAAIPILGERWGADEVLATTLMAAGLALLLREEHRHVHRHEEMEHDHAHVHEGHHFHVHPTREEVGEPHAHPHRHPPLTHDHPHVSELHHRHEHG